MKRMDDHVTWLCSELNFAHLSDLSGGRAMRWASGEALGKPKSSAGIDHHAELVGFVGP